MSVGADFRGKVASADCRRRLHAEAVFAEVYHSLTGSDVGPGQRLSVGQGRACEVNSRRR